MKKTIGALLLLALLAALFAVPASAAEETIKAWIRRRVSAVLPQFPLRRDEGRRALPPRRDDRHSARREGG